MVSRGSTEAGSLVFLEDLLDAVVSLPADVQRNLSLIKEQAAIIDAQTKALNATIEAATKAKAGDRSERLAQARLHLVNLLQNAEERLSLAEQMHRGVDVQVKRVEEDLEGLAEERRLQKLYGGIEIDDEESEAEGVESLSRKRKTSDSSDGKNKARKVKEEPKVPKPGAPQSPRRNQPVKAAENAAEPTYCICGQVSFGEMVACDDAACDVEWFHLDCVGLQSPPQGKWYCNNCEARRLKNQPE